jgi:flagellar biosynthesis anti-sigma factor FlgM
MKIEDRSGTLAGLGQIGQPQAPTRGATPAGADPSRRGAATDEPAATVVLSSRARELHSALQAVREAPDVRPEVVADVRSRLEQGRYNVDPEATAGGILDLRA